MWEIVAADLMGNVAKIRFPSMEAACAHVDVMRGDGFVKFDINPVREE